LVLKDADDIQVGSWVAVKLGTRAVRTRANAPLLKESIGQWCSEIILEGRTNANPNAIMPQMPILTRRGSLTFHKNMIGKTERIKSVAAAIATKNIVSL
jgi:hypothetical protein